MLPSEIISSLSHRFEYARKSGDLLFFPSTVLTHDDSGIEFQITLCPTFQKKSLLSTVDSEAELTTRPTVFAVPNEKKIVDPFAPPYNPNLHLGDLQDKDGEEYVVLLNKYSVIPEHFLLVTKEFRSQSSPLMPCDLVQAYQLLVEARKAGKKFLAFYNCGDHSGASQPHKHVQFIPVQEDGPPIEVLARAAVLEVRDKPFSLNTLPYANHVVRLPSHFPSDRLEQELSTVFLSLLDLGLSTIRYDPDYPPGKLSYNVLLSLEHMHLIPRRQDSYVLPKPGGTLNINALGFAGMLLVANGEELAALRGEGIGKILRAVGLESVHEEQVAGTSREIE